ncbi:MAG: hypothetical protein ABIM85_00265 [candidate division WOR-3 bacterium]
MKKKIKRKALILILFLYLFLLIFIRGKVIEKSKEVYKREKELLELEYRAINNKMEFLKALFFDSEKEKYYVEK